MVFDFTTLTIIAIALFYFGRLIKKFAKTTEEIMEIAVDGMSTARKIAEVNIGVWEAEQRAELSKRADEVKEAESFEQIMAKLKPKSTVA